MVYNALIKLVKTHIYIVSSEKYKSTGNAQMFERFTGKHPLLTPELIVVNDQPYGFKRTQAQLKTLEGFPIYFEVNYTGDHDNDGITIESVELYSEITISIHNKIAGLTRACDLFQSAIYTDRVKRIGDNTKSSLIIYSKLSDLFIDHFFEDEIEENMITLQEVTTLMHDKIKNFINFIKVLDDILFKNKKIDSIDMTLLF